MSKIKNIFKLYVSILLYIFGLNLNAQNPFIENKGQFPKQVKAKINLPSGSLFIEKGKLIYGCFFKMIFIVFLCFLVVVNLYTY